MKYVFLFPLFQGPYGGERHCLRLMTELEKQGHEIMVWTLKWSNSCNALMASSGITKKIFPIPHLPHTLEVMWSVLAMKLMAKKIRAHYRDKKNLIMVGMGWQSTYALHDLRKTFPNVVYYCLEPPRFLYDLVDESGIIKKNFIKIFGNNIKKNDAKIVRKIPKILSNSAWTHTQIQSIYKRESAIIYPGIETERFQKKSKSQSRQKLRLPTDRKILLSIGKLHKRKCLDKAIQYALEPSNENALFYIIGTGPEEKNLREYVKQTQAKNIIFLGEQTDEQVTDYLVAADEFLFFAMNEPFGMVTLEAKLAGCTLIPKQQELPLLTWSESARNFIKITNP